MAKNDNRFPVNKKLGGLMSGLGSNMSNLYSNTYFNTTRNADDLASVVKGVNDSIDRITNNNVNSVGIPNISKLYSRIRNIQGDATVIKDIQNVFDDNVLMDGVLGSYMQNKYLRDLDNEIDIICRYVPKLLEALDTRKDNVLSADHFSKDFVNVVSSVTTVSDEASFSERITNLKDRYAILDLLEDTYDNAAKYGEVFLYIVPYKKALSKLLQDKSNTMLAQLRTESATIISEGADTFQMDDCKDIFTENFSISIEINTSNVIESLVDNMRTADSKLKSINESALNYVSESEKIEKSDKFTNKTINDDLRFDDFKSYGSDGLITNDREDNERKINVPGCVVKKLDRSSVVPIYIDEICLGYYYLEFMEDDVTFSMANSLSDPMATMKSNKLHKEVDDIKNDQMLRYISSQLSRYIDSKFINNNQDLRNEIYAILKYNDVFNANSANKFKVTFIPPEDMIHVAFKKDPKTHRGISDLERALFPAKLYACLYITNTLAAMTRGQDKRVYYVKQNVDTNIAKTLLNTINQIKKSNFGIRQIENINNILNITGRFNDYVIPLGPTGDAPVQFEVMPGQNTDIKTDLMNILEEQAINSTDVPLELIQARQSIDYAVQLTMTNSKFLRKVYNRQSKYQPFCSEIVTKLYNGEYGTDSKLVVNLPPPMFLNITNTNQIIDNTKQYVNSIWEEDTSTDDDEVFKAIYKRKLLEYHLGSYIDIAKHKEIRQRAEMEAAKIRKEPPENQE